MKRRAVFAALILTLVAGPLAVAQTARLGNPAVPPATPPSQHPPAPSVAPPLTKREKICRDEANEEGMRGAQREAFLRRCAHR